MIAPKIRVGTKIKRGALDSGGTESVEGKVDAKAAPSETRCMATTAGAVQTVSPWPPAEGAAATGADSSADEFVDGGGSVSGATANVADAVEFEAPVEPPMSAHRLATFVGLAFVVGLAALVGWLGIRAHETYQFNQQRNLFLQVGRQGAINLTTIDWQHADSDVQRILDSATGTFRDDFAKRSQPFIDVVKQAQSTSVGTVTEAGLESASRDEAQVLVALSVKTSNAAGATQDPRAWRMRISVRRVGNDAKVSNVQLVP